MTGELLFRRLPDGTARPVKPYPDTTFIAVDLLDQLGDSWRDPDDRDVLRFDDDCRYLICEYRVGDHAFTLSRLP